MQLATSMWVATTDPASLADLTSPEALDPKVAAFEGRARGLATAIARPGEDYQIGASEALLLSNGGALGDLLAEGGDRLVGRLAGIDRPPPADRAGRPQRPVARPRRRGSCAPGRLPRRARGPPRRGLPPARLVAPDQLRIPLQLLRDAPMAERRRDSFCGSPEHAFDRRRFLGTMAASAAAALAADMTALDVLTEPALAGELKKQAEARDPALAGGRGEPARDVGPEAGRRDRRAVPVDPDGGPRHRDLGADAEDGPADEAHLHHPLAEHQERRPRRRRPPDDAGAAATTRACTTPTSAP